MEKKPDKSQRTRDIAFYILIAIFAASVTGVCQIQIVPTGSMEPTIQTGSFNIQSAIPIWLGHIERGDIILFENKEVEIHHKLIKRVIGMPGDVVTIEHGAVYINGVRLDESEYLASDVATTVDSGGEYIFTVPENSYFVLGDNRGVSYDSRFWANPFISREHIYQQILLSFPVPFWRWLCA